MDIIPYHRPLVLTEMERKEIYSKYDEVEQSGILTNGKYVQELEETVRKMYNVNYCIALTSCTQGFIACLNYLQQEDCNFDCIWLPAFIWKSIGYVLDLLGIDSLYLDIDKETWLPIKDFRSDCPTIGLHTFGNVSKEEWDIVDASHAFGCKLRHIGKATVFSLAPTKLITSYEGGLVITNEYELAESVREYRNLCARMTEIQAIKGLTMITHLEEVKKWKHQIYMIYKRTIPGIFQRREYDHNFNTIGFLNEHNLEMPSTFNYRQYYVPLQHHQPNTNEIFEKIICLPSYMKCNYFKIIEDIVEVNGL